MNNGNMFATMLEAAMPTEADSHCLLAVLSIESLPDYTTGRLKRTASLNTVKIILHYLCVGKLCGSDGDRIQCSVVRYNFMVVSEEHTASAAAIFFMLGFFFDSENGDSIFSKRP
jgi:hypothetical protein